MFLYLVLCTMQQCHTAKQLFPYKLMFNFEQYQNRISSIYQKYRVRNLTAFGSVVSEHFHEQSDIDFLIELDSAQDGLKRYMNVKFELELLFFRHIDLVMPRTIKKQRIKEYIFPTQGCCMPHDPFVFLEDAIAACKLIQQFTQDMNEEQYAADLKTQSAVGRQFEIIGESLNSDKAH